MAHPEETLIVVVGDHETGGMGLGMDSMGYKLDMTRLLSTRIERAMADADAGSIDSRPHIV